MDCNKNFVPAFRHDIHFKFELKMVRNTRVNYFLALIVDSNFPIRFVILDLVFEVKISKDFFLCDDVNSIEQ